MNWYLATRYSRHPEMQEKATVLRHLGHEVTSRWILGDHEGGPGTDDETKARFAIEDMEDLMKSDGVISFTEAVDRSKHSGRGGRHVEFGVGVMANKRMVIVGPQEHVFHWLPNVEHYDTWEDFLDTLEEED